MLGASRSRSLVRARSSGALAALGCAASMLVAQPTRAQTTSQVLAWEFNNAGQCNVPALPAGLDWTDISAGDEHSLGLLSDGTIVGWGWCGALQCAAPPLPPGVVYQRISAGSSFSAAVRSDGAIVVFGSNDAVQGTVPALPPGVVYVDVDGIWGHVVALRSDGQVVAWGANAYGQCNVPPLPPGLTYVEARAGVRHSAARRSDGSLVAWGTNGVGECDVPVLAPGLSYVEVSVSNFTLARVSDGTLRAFGYDDSGVTNVPALPPGVVYVEIDASWRNGLARRSDGTVVSWGTDQFGQNNVPLLPDGMACVQLSSGQVHSMMRLAPAPGGGSVASYCWPAPANTVSPQGANFTVLGRSSLSANDLVFHVSNLPVGGAGIFYYGARQGQTPFGGGFRCVQGAVQRVPTVLIADASGSVTHGVDLSLPPFSGSPNAIEAGSAWNFQYWYRDPAGSTTTFNLSDANHIVFVP